MAKVLGHNLVRGLIGDVLSVVDHRSGACFDQSADGAKSGGLACSIGTDQSDNTSLFDLEVHSVEGLDRAVGDATRPLSEDTVGIIVTGSVVTVGEARTYLRKKFAK